MTWTQWLIQLEHLDYELGRFMPDADCGPCMSARSELFGRIPMGNPSPLDGIRLHRAVQRGQSLMQQLTANRDEIRASAEEMFRTLFLTKSLRP